MLLGVSIIKNFAVDLLVFFGVVVFKLVNFVKGVFLIYLEVVLLMCWYLVIFLVEFIVIW